MSRSAQGGCGQPEDKRHGFSRFMRRASRVFRRGSTNRGSAYDITALQAGASGTSPTALAVQSSRYAYRITFEIPTFPTEGSRLYVSPTLPSAEPPIVIRRCPSVPAAISQSIRDINKSYNATPYRTASSPGVTSDMQQERARALFAKYGLTLGPGDWTPPSRSNAERVEKPIRMRVHRQCHQCQTTFGRDKVCSSCDHVRCTKCPRYPARKKKKAPEVERSAAGASSGADPGSGTGLLVVDKKSQSNAGDVVLVMPGRTPGTELVRRGPLQRVRRICHRCESVFQGKGQACINCSHERCPKCPRDPPKLNKFPSGYPGDADETFPLAERYYGTSWPRSRYQCHSCSAVFKEHESICGTCDHERCLDCPRYPPKRIKVQPVEALMDSVAQKLAVVDLTPQASAV